MAIQNGQYIYCIIGTGEARNFGPIGIGNRGDSVTTIAYGDLGAVVSGVSMAKYTLSEETMLAHERVIEVVMKDHTVLPVRFCTVAPNAEEIRNLLRSRGAEFRKLLRELDNQVELGIKAWWKNTDAILREIRQESEDIQRLRDQTPFGRAERWSAPRNDVARAIQAALQAKKAKEREVLVSPLKRIASQVHFNRIYGDDMVVSAAFLVDKGREREFDAEVNALAAKYGDRIELKYVGPVPPYSFVNIEVKEVG